MLQPKSGLCCAFQIQIACKISSRSSDHLPCLRLQMAPSNVGLVMKQRREAKSCQQKRRAEAMREAKEGYREAPRRRPDPRVPKLEVSKLA
jgi:hypothetical protein